MQAGPLFASTNFPRITERPCQVVVRQIDLDGLSPPNRLINDAGQSTTPVAGLGRYDHWTPGAGAECQTVCLANWLSGAIRFWGRV